MLNIFLLIENKRELLIGLSVSVLYITYYLVEVVKRPALVGGAGAFRALLERLPLLRARYWPTPWCVEARLQTVLGSLLRSRLLPRVPHVRQLLRLRDGGTVALDWLAGGTPGGPVLLVVPGLTGCAQADYVRCLAPAARALGARAVVLTQRGLGGLPLTSPRLYCALSHEDLAEVARELAGAARGRPLLAVGVSLGGLILGQYLAQYGDRACIAAALIVSSPLDVVRGSQCMERGLTALLSRHMARSLRRTVGAHARLREVAGWDWAAVQRCRSVREFDAAFTTKHFGFGSVDAYYRAASLHDKLARVRVPLLCLQAADDPFQPAAVLPLAAAAGWERAALAVPARGGHIGFLEGWWPLGDQYMARLAEQYFAALLAEPALLHCPPPTEPTLLNCPPSTEPTLLNCPPSTEPTLLNCPPPTEPTLLNCPPSTEPTLLNCPPSTEPTLLNCPLPTEPTEPTLP